MDVMLSVPGPQDGSGEKRFRTQSELNRTLSLPRSAAGLEVPFLAAPDLPYASPPRPGIARSTCRATCADGRTLQHQFGSPFGDHHGGRMRVSADDARHH